MHLYKGKEYKTKKAVMHAAGVDYTCCRGWIAIMKLSHLPLEEAIDRYQHRQTVSRDTVYLPNIIYKGKEYRSRNALCEAVGISKSSLALGLHYGMSLEDAVERVFIYRQKVRESRTDHLGNEYESMDAMCRTYGIPRDIYRNRLKIAWTKEKALTAPIKRTGRPRTAEKKYYIDHLGNKFDNAAEMCRYYGIAPETFRYRRFIRQMTVKDALTIPVRPYNC